MGFFEGMFGYVLFDYVCCIKISIDVSFCEMVLFVVLVILVLIIMGIFFGVRVVTGFFVGGFALGV